MAFWNERYSKPGFVFGEVENDYLRSAAKHLKPNSTILSIGEGEGRNAWYLANLGHNVVCMDESNIGLEKLRKRAMELGIENKITTICADLNDFEFGKYDAVISIWCHLPPVLRQKVFNKVADALLPGGYFILEAYTPSNIGRGTGGPQEADKCLSKQIILDDFKGKSVKFIELNELERDISEGQGHNGMSACVQVLLQKES